MDDHEFEQRISKSRRAVTAYLYTCCGDLSLAEDIVQDTCLIAFKKRDKYLPDADFCAWMIAIARNLWLRELKKRKIRQTARQYLQDNASLLFTAETYGEDRLRQEKEALRDCLGKLALQDQRMIRDHFFGKMKYDAIADKFQRTLSWVKVRMYRSRLALRECVRKTLNATPAAAS